MLYPKEYIQGELDSLAGRVENMGDDHTGARLRDLGAAMTGNRAPDDPAGIAWVDADVYKLIDPDRVADNIRGLAVTDPWLGTLELLRNISILFPLLLTWYALSRAVNQYHEFLRDNPSQITEPFLYLWQDNFGRRGESLTLSRVASLDALLLLLIVALTIAVYWRAVLMNRKRDAEAEQIRAELGAVLARAAFVLAQERARRPNDLADHIDAIVHDLLTQIREERERAHKLVEEKQQEYKAVNAVVLGLAGVGAEMLESARRLQVTSTQLGDTMNSLSKVVKEAADQQTSLLTAMQETSGKLSMLVAQQEKVVNGVGTMNTDLSTGIKTLNEGAPKVAALAITLGEFTQTLVDNQASLLNGLEAQRQAQETMAGTIAQAAEGLTGSLASMNEYANLLHGLAIDLSTLTRNLGEVPKSFEDGFSAILIEQEKTARNVAQASQVVTVTAENIDQTVRNVMPFIRP